MMEPHKVCPLAAAHPQQENSNCLGEACACYVIKHKHRTKQTDQGKIDDPKFFYRYKGCGLVAQVPWKLVKREKNSDSPA
jgi:hypothetical protein